MVNKRMARRSIMIAKGHLLESEVVGLTTSWAALPFSNCNISQSLPFNSSLNILIHKNMFNCIFTGDVSLCSVYEFPRSNWTGGPPLPLSQMVIFSAHLGGDRISSIHPTNNAIPSARAVMTIASR
jgi:hypothetical protein